MKIRHRVYEQPILKMVEYRFGDRSFKMELDLTDAPECSYYLGDPTPQLTCLIRRGGGVLIDIGANVGLYSLAAGLFFDEVHAIEPAPGIFRRLARNVELSDASNVTAANLAMSDHQDTLEFWECEGHGGMSRVISRPTNRSIHVRATTLDAYVEEYNVREVDFIKIDVECHEVPVFRGARRTLERDGPMIFAELFDRRRTQAVLDGLPSAYRVFNPATGEEIDRRDAPKGSPHVGNLLFAISNPYSEETEEG
jgi:FkbM family methyltransferase